VTRAGVAGVGVTSSGATAEFFGGYAECMNEADVCGRTTAELVKSRRPQRSGERWHLKWLMHG
ncbi:hypothetical protein E2562_035967, partial [Oryza meyeriana var. granulata]